MRLAFFLLALVAIALLLPFFVSGNYVLHVVILCYIAIMLAVSLDLVTGYAGQFTFAHGAFYGIGAYTAAILERSFNTSFWVNLPAGILFAGLAGLILGVPALRLRGHFLAIITVAFQTVVLLIISEWTDFTGGHYGLSVSPIPGFTAVRQFYFLAFALALVTCLLCWGLVSSRVGLRWRSVRDDEVLAGAIGIHTTSEKLTAFAVSSAIAGGAGVLFAHYIRGVSPPDFSVWTSALVLAMVVVGGRATLLGPALGAIILTALPEFLRGMQDYKLLTYGILMILMVRFMPGGLVGSLAGRWK